MTVKSPNILFINTDQLRADFLGAYGFPAETSPNIDRLARGGIRFERAFTQCTICVPARYSLTTGLYVSNHGAISNNHATYPTARSLLEAFNANGYKTVCIGKLHHNPPDLKFGFREVYLHDGGFPERRLYSIYSRWLADEGVDENELWYPVGIDDVPEKRRLKDRLHWGRCRLPEKHCESTFLSNFAVDYVKKYPKDKPIFLYLSYVAPHSPYCPPAPYDEMFDPAKMPAPRRETDQELARKHPAIRLTGERFGPKGIPDQTMREVRAQYAGMIRHLDDQIGRAVAAFRETFGKNVLIALTSDHGDFLGEHYKCEKHWMYEAAVQVPFILNWPGKIPADTMTKALVEQIDMFPTVLGLAGAKWDQTHVAGRDLSRGIMTGRVKTAKFVFSENRDNIGPTAAYMAMLRSAHYKLIAVLSEDPAAPIFWEFYDLEKDPGELDNLINRPKYKKLIEEHRRAFFEKLLQIKRYDPPARGQS